MKRIDYYKNNLKGEAPLDFPIEEPSLFPEYYTVALSRFLEREQAYNGSLFNEKEENDAFLAREIKCSNESIIEINILLKDIVQSKLKYPEKLKLKEEMQLNITNYSLYLNYLSTLQQKVIKLNSIEIPQQVIPASITVKQLALKLVYERKIITRENASSYLIGNLKSGDNLYNTFTKLSNRTDRGCQS